MFAAYFLLLVLPLVSAQVKVQGHCPVPHVQPDFNLHMFLGMWYELARIPSPFSQGACVTAEYKMPKRNSYVVGQHTQLINGEFSYSSAILRVSDSGEPAKLEIKFSERQAFRPYWILHTDYETYAVVYTCEERGNAHYQYAWIIGRKPYLDPNTLQSIILVLMNEGIYANNMEVTDQSCYTKTHSKKG